MRKFFLLALFLCALPALVHATALVNINTADVALLDTLPGIGPSKAAAIVEYRQAHGLFAQTRDIESVSGIKGATFAKIAALITVGDAGTPVVPIATTPEQPVPSIATPPAPQTVTSVARVALIPLISLSATGVTLTNRDSVAIDLSHWQLASGSSIFTLAEGTMIRAGGSETFAPSSTGFAGVTDVSLFYPSGKLATAVAAGPPQPLAQSTSGAGQPSPAPARSQSGTSITKPAHAAPAVRAPASSTEVAAAGAALPTVVEPPHVAAPSRVTGVLTSPWTLGFLGLLVFSAGAFILL